MNTEVGQAYHTVQLSAKEMIKNNRRQHYCNILDLLANSCKACGLLATSFTNDELIQFWLCDVLPLMFDTDRNIQTSAINALAEALVAIDIADIHSSSIWMEVKSDFVDKYAPLIGEMRDAKNSNWHKIWTLLVQIMDNELLRGCSYINKFLAIVELGFRNPDNAVRSEAFLCWRVLIKIFAAYNELAISKRLRLLLIPLRTSQSRSSHVSGIKLRVWWYLLTCLDEELPKSFDNAVEYFLSFIFGGGARGAVTGLAHTYQTARELALPCLIALWSTESSEGLQRLMRELRLETLTQPSPLMRTEILEQHWRPMLAAAMTGMELLCQNDSTDIEQQLLHMLARNLTLAMFRLNVKPFIVACCEQFEKTLPAEGRIVRLLFNTCAAENLTMSYDDDCLDVLEALMRLCIKARSEVPATVLQRCIAIMFAPDNLKAAKQTEFRQLTSFAELLMQTNDDEDYDGFAVRLIIWRHVSAALVNYLRGNSLEYRLAHNAHVLDKWILWPLHTCAGFAGRRINTAFDNTFCDHWRQLLNTGHNAPDRKNFLNELKSALVELLKSTKEEPNFAELFDAYVSAVVKFGLCKDTPMYKDVFALLMDVFELQMVPQQTLEGCLNTLRNVIVELRQNELMVIFDVLKPTLAAAIHCWNKHKFEGSFLNEWKRCIQEKFRKLPVKNMTNQLKDLFKNDELFVIIPSVWSLNPDKLTDRQKERLAEKSDIPALYNDMSQSNESSIKPWTPKKLVIAKTKQAELVIGGVTEDEPIVVEESVTTQRTRRQTIDVMQGSGSIDKYNFRRPRVPIDEDNTPNKKPFLREETPVRQTRQRVAQKEDEIESAQSDPHSSPSKRQPQQNTPNKLPTTKQSKIEPAKPMTTASEDLFPESATTPTLQAQVVEVPKIPSDALETQLSNPLETPIETVKSVQILPESQFEPVQETSPKKINTRLSNLNSPPDRKQTSNASSPTLRPKPSAHLTGRGAQLINMIRNKKLDIGSQHPLASSVQVRNRQPDRADVLTTPTSELYELTGTDHTSTPIQNRDLLIFRKQLPSPSASPSASILKRKLRSESIDDVSIDSPALKRKRVSFHDPPVSVTKEYLRDTDETRSKPKRCLMLDKFAPTSEIKNALKRRGRLDSIIEIEKFAKEQSARTAHADKSMEKSNDPIEDEAFTTLKWNESTANPASIPDANTSSKKDPIKDGRDLAVMDPNIALDLVVDQCSLDDVLQRYFTKPNAAPLKQASTLARFLSTQMTANEKLKMNVLEMLSENHSKDFLDHAVRENLSSVVCDRLNSNSVLSYICSKAKINSSCRSSLLAQLPEIVKSSRVDSERLSFIQDLLVQCSFNDDQLLDVISHLMRGREKRDCNIVDVAETAADSSSNL